MKQSEFVKELAQELGCSRKQADKTLKIMFELIAREVEVGNDIYFSNFGTFSRKYRTERLGINPAHGGKLTIPAHYLPVFRAGEAFKRRVKNIAE